MGGAILFAAAVAVAGPVSRVEIRARGEVQQSSFPSANAEARSGGAYLALSIFAQRPVIDDDSPYALQPFLQRAGRVWIEAGGGGAQLDQEGYGTYARSRGGTGRAGFDLHVHRWVALTGSFTVGGARFDQWNAPSYSTLSLHGSVGMGIRWEDFRFDVAYALGSTHLADHWTQPFYGHVLLGAHVVVAQKISLFVNVEVIDGGAAAGIDFNGYLTKKLGLNFGLSGSRVELDGRVYGTLGGQAGVSGWFSRYIGLGISYSPTWTAGTNLVAHNVDFWVVSRAK